ncbi:MAG: Fe-S cluster assembly protein SufB, partial [Pseudomonadota bacterium]
MATALETVQEYTGHTYKYGFFTDIETEYAPPGLNDDIVRFISGKKNEPAWLTEWRLQAYRRFGTMEQPEWQKPEVDEIDLQGISYYAAPSQKEVPKSLDEIDPEIRRTYEKLGIPIEEQKMLAGVAVDYVFDSVSVATTFKA